MNVIGLKKDMKAFLAEYFPYDSYNTKKEMVKEILDDVEINDFEFYQGILKPYNIELTV